MNPQKAGVVFLFVLLAEVLNAFGQYSFKKTVNDLCIPKLSALKSYAPFFKKVLAAPQVWLGLGVMAASLVFWLMALSQGDLSFVYPIGSLQYILVLLVAHFFLKEKIDKNQVLGTLLVAGGIFLIAMS